MPFAALAEDVINKVVGSIGNVLSKELNNTKKKATNPPYFCISTIHFEKIQQTRVVNIDNQQFEILIQELENNTHKSSPANVQEEPNPTPPSSFSMETNAFPDDEATHVDKVYEVNSVACSSTCHQHSDSNVDPITIEYNIRDDRIQNWNSEVSPQDRLCPVSNVWGVRLEDR